MIQKQFVSEKDKLPIVYTESLFELIVLHQTLKFILIDHSPA